MTFILPTSRIMLLHTQSHPKEGKLAIIHSYLYHHQYIDGVDDDTVLLRGVAAATSCHCLKWVCLIANYI